MRGVLDQAAEWQKAGRSVAMATVIETWGSAPQPVGSQLAADLNGNFIGSVSGGCVEGAVITEAAGVIGSGVPKVLEFGVADETAWRVGLACGGRIRILVEPLGQIDELMALRRGREAVAVVTELASGRQILVRRADASPELEDAFRFDQSRVQAGPAGEVFVHIHNPPLKLVITGAVHIAQSLVPMALAAGYDIAVVDPRGAFATAERFPGVALYDEWPDEFMGGHGLDARTAVLALTHDPKIDDPALRAALKSEAFYIGALGSKKTSASRRERLMALGFSEADLARIHGPVGLNIGAKGAAEIAVSILAEMTKVLRLGDVA